MNAPKGIETFKYESANDLSAQLEKTITGLKDRGDVTIIMAAAPADYRPQTFSDKKLPKSKGEGMSLELAPNADIIKGIAERRKEYPNLKKIVAFAANDSKDLMEKASEKLKEKKVDFIVANDVFSSVNQEMTELFLIDRNGLRGSSKRVTKKAAASWLIGELFSI